MQGAGGVYHHRGCVIETCETFGQITRLRRLRVSMQASLIVAKMSISASVL